MKIAPRGILSATSIVPPARADIAVDQVQSDTVVAAGFVVMPRSNILAQGRCNADAAVGDFNNQRSRALSLISTSTASCGAGARVASMALSSRFDNRNQLCFGKRAKASPSGRPDRS